MEVITCHINADFDALASMMAAKKLYPDAHLVFPGAQERSLREFFLQSTIYAMKFDRVKDIDMGQVTRLILVDTKSRDRIGRFNEILDKPGLSIHVYDHHPFTAEDIRGEFEHVEQLGACTTIFTELLREKNIPLTPTEATIMALGVYEETGSLVFTSTTPRDIQAAAWLLSKGANLNIVADFITRELDADQIGLLNDLLKSIESYYFDGVKVSVASASSKKYIQDIAVLSHKIRDIENIDVIFCVVRMEDRIHIVARSRIREVDVGAVVHEFGGGGHPTAASATVHETALNKVVDRLLGVLKKSIRGTKTAGDIMTSPVISIRDSATIQDAEESLTRYGVNVLPVLRGSRLTGLVSREVVQRSLHHGLGERPVTEVMYTDFKTADQKTALQAVEELMIRHNQRFLPITEDDRVIGAITRTDLLRAIHDSASGAEVDGETGMKGEDAYSRNVAGLMRDRLPAETLRLLSMLGKKADEFGYSIYAVGGFVRDLLLGVENFDLDVVVEGQGIPFALDFAKEHGARVRVHQKFGTAVIIMPTRKKFDIATARTEYYEYPAALPTVEVGSIKKDLYRRDFTVNALAIKINENGFGELIDFFGGQRDIKEKTIRVLHNLSLIEDPTRAFRAVRFENRMGFTTSKHTQNLIKNAVKMELFHRLAGSRVYAELVLIFKETRPLNTMRRLEDFRLLKFIHHRLRLTKDFEALFISIEETLAWFKLLFLDVEADIWVVYFMALFNFVPEKEVDEFGTRLTIPERHKRKIKLARREGNRLLSDLYRNPGFKPYEVYTKLKPLPVEVLLFMMAKAKEANAKKNISMFLTHYNSVQPMLTGDDLMKIGLKPGPVYKRILEKLLEASMNGDVETPEDEESFVLDLLKRQHLLKGPVVPRQRKASGGKV